MPLKVYLNLNLSNEEFPLFYSSIVPFLNLPGLWKYSSLEKYMEYFVFNLPLVLYILALDMNFIKCFHCFTNIALKMKYTFLIWSLSTFLTDASEEQMLFNWPNMIDWDLILRVLIIGINKLIQKKIWKYLNLE